MIERYSPGVHSEQEGRFLLGDGENEPLTPDMVTQGLRLEIVWPTHQRFTPNPYEWRNRQRPSAPAAGPAIPPLEVAVIPTRSCAIGARFLERCSNASTASRSPAAAAGGTAPGRAAGGTRRAYTRSATTTCGTLQRASGSIGNECGVPARDGGSGDAGERDRPAAAFGPVDASHPARRADDC